MAYDHEAIERAAREKWASRKTETDLASSDQEPYYLLVEFPYPSGDLHIGHWFAFSVTDIFARLLRARGKNVFFPIGFDAFGLPAENAAIKHGVDPRKWTYENIERMRGQLESMGASFDWSKHVITCEPEYYQWTQWLFIKLLEQGLAERKEAAVKWCPKDQTVLANEQVVDGACERCGTAVQERRLTQWFLKITQYADRLLSGLTSLPWREEIKDAQRAWIGKSEGAEIDFALQAGEADQGLITVFTTRADTVFGATYVVLAPEHPFVVRAVAEGLIENADAVHRYLTNTEKKTERERSEQQEKTGVMLEGVTATNPATKSPLPVYVADYVLGSYGTGAVMAVPAHDERDYEFATVHMLPIVRVISSDGELPYTGDGSLVDSGSYSGRNSVGCRDEITSAVGGRITTQYRLRDWLVSRQRYWGCPIPVVYDPEGKPHPVPAEHLPWLLPTDVDFTPNDQSPLASSAELKERVTRIFGEGWTPEYDTLDTFVDSSWYFTRYLSPHNTVNFSDPEMMRRWLPVNRYSGGSEHTTMHLLYARFFIKALYDMALVPIDEPFVERYNRGLIMGPDGQKMSKSKGNVLNPDEFVRAYGADAVRTYLAFIGPYNEPRSYPWQLDGVASMRKFLDRVYRQVERASNSVAASPKLESAVALAAQKIAGDGERFKFNTAVAALMILVNECETCDTLPTQVARQLVILLAPFAPHLAEHLWERVGGDGSVHEQAWPTLGGVEEARKVVVQVNGKRRGAIELGGDTSEDEAVREARRLPAVAAIFGGREPTRVIYVPKKIINFVL